MTTPCVSPSRFHGLPWESWTNSFGKTSPADDKSPELKKDEKNKAGVMKLPKEDMKIFGLCPERDIFTVVVCETCNMCIKPQALLEHFEMRHMNKDVAPPKPVISEVAVKEKTTTKVIKAIVKNPPTKVKTKKTPNKESSKNKEAINPTPSLPVSLTLETTMPNPGTSKGETLQPVVSLTPLAGTPISPAAPVLSKSAASAPAVAVQAVAPVLTKAKRPPRKHAPIKEREFDPDKHCGVISPETMKPCTWSLTCKSHQMSLRRAVTGRSKPFDQLLADHRQAKEALTKQKKNLELQNSSVMLTPPSSQSSGNGDSKVQTPTAPPAASPVVTPAASHLPTVQRTDPKTTTVLFRLPELSLDVTPTKQLYLSASPTSLVVKGSERLVPPLTTPLSASTPVTTSTIPMPTATQLDVVTFTLNHPKALNAPMFSHHKIGGLVYTSRRMRIARQGMENCLHRAGSSIYLAATAGCSRDVSSSTLSTMLNSVTSHLVKQPRQDKPGKTRKKVCFTNDMTSLLDIQINSLKSVMNRQHLNAANNRSTTSNHSTTNNRPATNNPPTNNRDFHIPNILSNALKRSSDTPLKGASNKKKKKNSQIMSSLLTTNHTKNGIVPSKSSGSFVRVAITNGKVEPDTKTLGLCETPKFANGNKILNEADLRKLGLRFEIYE